MQLELNQPATGNDLARLLEGDQGSYIAQSGGLTFLVTCSQGHSIRSLRQIGSSGNEWTVTKISQRELTEDSPEAQSYRAAGGAQRG